MARLTEGTQDLRLSGIANPVTDSDAVNKRYVDSDIAAVKRLIHEDTDLHAGRGLEKTPDSEIQSIGGKIRTYNRTSNMLSETGQTWTRGDLVNITDQDSWLNISGITQSPYPINDQSATQIIVDGLTQAQATLIQNSGWIAIDATGLYRRRITGVAIPYTTGKVSGGSSLANGQIVFNIAGVAIFATNAVWYLSAAGGIEGGVYVFNADSDMRGATTISNWTKLLNNEIDISRLDSEFQEIQRAIALIDSELAHAVRYTHGYGIEFQALDGTGATPIAVDTDTIASRRYVDSEIAALVEHDTTYTAGYGLNLSSDSEFSVDSDTIASRRYVDSEIAAVTFPTFDSDNSGLVRHIKDPGAAIPTLFQDRWEQYYLAGDGHWRIATPQVSTHDNNEGGERNGVQIRFQHNEGGLTTTLYAANSSTIYFDTDHDGSTGATANQRFDAHVDTDVIASRAWVTEQFHPTGSTGRFTRDTDGLVPHPDSDNQPNYYLGGDGQWHRLLSTSIFTEQNPGLVPAPGFSDQNYFLSASGTWEHAVDLIDSDNIIPALEALNSRWDSDDHSIEVYANIHHPAVPAVPATGGREASFVVTITGSGNTSDGDFLQLRVPAKGATVDNQDTDIFNLVMHNPNISGFAYPPQNANGIRDVLAAYLDQTRYPNRNNVPYIDFVAVSTDGLQHNQLEITVRETRPGFIDTDNFIISNSFDGYGFEVIFADTDREGVWPTTGHPAVPAHDSEHIIIDQVIPEFGTTEQGNRTFDPGLVPTPDLLQRNDNHILTGLGNWVHESTISGGGDTTWRGRWQQDTEYSRNDVVWNPNDNVLYYWDSDATPASDVIPHIQGNIRSSQPQITRLTFFANTNGTVRVGVYDTDGTYEDTDILLAGVTNNNTFARLIAQGINASHLSRIVTASFFGSRIDLTWDSDRAVPTGFAGFYPPTGTARNGVILDNPTDNPALESILSDTANSEVQDGFVRFTGRNHWNNLGDRVENLEYDRDSDKLTVYSSTGAQSVVISDSNPSNQAEIDALQAELNAGIGAIPVEDTGDLKGPRDFTGWNVSADSETLTFYVNGDDSDGWSAFDDQFNDLLYLNDNPASIHFQLNYVQPGDTVFRQVNLVFESADDGSNEVFVYDHDSDKIVFQLTNGTGHPGDRFIRVTDGAGDVTGPAAGLSGGAGYFRHVYAYNDRDQESGDIASQFNSIGIQHYDYAAVYPTGIPVVVANNDTQTPHISLMQAQGLWVDTESDRIIADQSIDTENYHQVVRMIDTFGISGSSTNPIQYDASDRPIVVPVTLYQGGQEVLHTKTIAYLPNNLPSSITYHLGTATGPVLAVKNIVYDASNRVLYTPITGG